jgi:hypothetical protein
MRTSLPAGSASLSASPGSFHAVEEATAQESYSPTTKEVPFFTPKGWPCSAQGIALGTAAPPHLLHPEGVAFFSPGHRPGEPAAPHPFFTPKGWPFSAQGIALGRLGEPNRSALKGRKNASGSGPIAPFQGWGCVQGPPSSQGVALG